MSFFCHPEFISGSYQFEVLRPTCKMLKQVQHNSFVLIVVKVPKQELCDKKILAELNDNCNVYHKLVLLIKLDIQMYYNMRIILGYETVQ